MRKYGIDISSHQGKIDFSSLKDEVDFIILRAAWGTNTDTMFEYNYNECKKYSIPVGCYLYSYSLNTKTAIEEAKYLLKLISGKKFEYPIYIDMEDADNYKLNHGMPSNKVLNDICNNFCDAIESKGYYVGVYASEHWFNTKLTGIKKYDKWIANWGVNDGNINKDLSGLCGMMQYTSKKNILDRYLDGDIAYIDYPKIIKQKGLNGYKKNLNSELKVGDRVIIKTPGVYKYYIADDVKKIYGIYQIRENLNAGGAWMFNWRDNGIPEKFVDIVDNYGKKIINSDFIHVKKGSKFIFNRSFIISRITIDKGIKYYQLDARCGSKYKFWTVGTYLNRI